ncbi:MAG: indole-3-glycerol phosphate synthase TrpC [Phascolarctobacterium sp.]|nr:indole-3-glycerol phosphate synthase TrpC [Phascolarctobacterium sp.]
MTILDELAAYAKERVQRAQAVKSLEDVRRQALALPRGEHSFYKALGKPELSFICECKKASPSKGIIAQSFPYLEISKRYQQAGADCISVLTEPKWFLGRDAYLQEIAQNVQLPCLCKDFIVDEYMLYQAKLLGAAAVLLICTLLNEEQLRKYLAICEQLGMDALVEAHDEQEVQLALRVGARIIGVNNRNLKDFTVDMENSRRLRALVPPEVLFVAESGVRNAEDVRRLKSIGVDAVLIGEALMRAPDVAGLLRELKDA